MADRDRLGSSGVFNAIVLSARKFKRALTGDDEELSAEHEELGNLVARALVAHKPGDLYAMGSTELREHVDRMQFESQWRDILAGRGALTGFEVSNPGKIDLAFIPGLENVPQERFMVFLEIAFSTPEIRLDDERAFVIGVVFVDEGGITRLAAIHSR